MPPDITFDWVVFPSGRFSMGSDPHQAAPAVTDEFPLHLLDLPSFSLSRVPVTNEQYAHFVSSTRYPAPGHWGGSVPDSVIRQAPVTYVTWDDASAFCQWAGGRLPSEAEWEKAARGPAACSDADRAEPAIWPWGSQLPDYEKAHYDEHRRGVSPGEQSPKPVGQLVAGTGPFGHLDLAGNVWEWTSSRYAPYPWSDRPYQAADLGEVVAVRGGTYNHDMTGIRSAARTPMLPGARDVYIGFRLAASPDDRIEAGFDMVAVPAGPFWMGSKPIRRRGAVFPDEVPRHTVDLEAFALARYPVTNRQYRQFVDRDGHPPPPHWIDGAIPAGLDDHPVTWIDWNDAIAFCQWAGVRLPSEAEWERAAAGPVGRLFPWGDDEPDATRLALGATGTSTVGGFPAGATPEGVMDMAGNVWEWVQSRYLPYPVGAGDDRDTFNTGGRRVLRGGSFHSPGSDLLRCAVRSLSFETRRREHIGFRVARSMGGRR